MTAVLPSIPQIRLIVTEVENERKVYGNGVFLSELAIDFFAPCTCSTGQNIATLTAAIEQLD